MVVLYFLIFARKDKKIGHDARLGENNHYDLAIG